MLELILFLIKAHDAESLIFSLSLSQFTHSVLLFCPVSDVLTLTHIFYHCTLPCGLSGQMVTEVTMTSQSV